MTRRFGLRFICLLLLVGLVAAACGSDRGDDQSASSGGDGTTETTATSGGGAKTFGDLESPCGEGDAKGATDQGVTDDKIVIGYGDDAGFPQSPGLSHETSDAIKAFMKWCNDQGGINGRQVTGNYYDAKITEVANAITAACSEVFMLVGEAWSLDAGQEDARLGCNLPAVPTYSVSADFANAPLMYQAVPNPVDVVSAGFAAVMAREFPQEVKKTAVVYGNYSATIDTKDKYVAAYAKFGFQFDCLQEYNILGEADWKPLAQKLKDCGVTAVIYSGQPYPNGQNLLEAAAQIGFKPIWMWDSNSYVESFAKWNTNGYGDRNYIRTAFIPLEQADTNKATKDYIDIVKANGGDISQLGQQAASSFLLWATAAKACGSNLTRQCVMEELGKVTKWTGGGMHAETNPAENLPPTCVMVLKMEGTKFVQAFPKERGKFDCSPDYAVKISGRVVDQAKLGPDRVSTAHKK